MQCKVSQASVATLFRWAGKRLNYCIANLFWTILSESTGFCGRYDKHFGVFSVHSIYTLCLEKGPTFKLSETCQMLTDFQNFCTAEKRMNLLQNSFDITHLTLRMLLHYLEILKIQIFCICILVSKESSLPPEIRVTCLAQNVLLHGRSGESINFGAQEL